MERIVRATVLSVGVWRGKVPALSRTDFNCFMESEALDKSNFSVDTQYAITLKDESGKLRPANIYVYRLYDDFMIARRTSGNQTGMLFKIAYENITKVVKTIPVQDKKRFMLPEAVLNQKVWATRDTMMAYSSAPGLGK